MFKSFNVFVDDLHSLDSCFLLIDLHRCYVLSTSTDYGEKLCVRQCWNLAVLCKDTFVNEYDAYVRQTRWTLDNVRVSLFSWRPDDLVIGEGVEEK